MTLELLEEIINKVHQEVGDMPYYTIEEIRGYLAHCEINIIRFKTFVNN